MSRLDAVAVAAGIAAELISDSKVLVVGAGGIGCELLKTLVLTGFRNLQVADLDTIDVSNLNRQFLFKRKHVGMSKSKVAAEAALGFLRDDSGWSCKIQDHQGNIMTSQFGAQFFKQFDLVLNALDNAEARRHVNRICVALNIPLVESGTGGYTGQVKPIIRGKTECFECDPSLSSSKQKSYPVCTIRNTPDKPVHCIVWAKHVFNALFGPRESDSHNFMTDLRLETEGSKEEICRKFFRKVFDDDIRDALKVSERWQSRSPPNPIDLDRVWKSGDHCKVGDQSVGTVEDMAALFMHSFGVILKTRQEDFGALTFDKDDKVALDFVTSAANLRMYNFGIAALSKFDLKGIAGNIIHAIATTNAIAAGLMVIQALNILSENFQNCKSTWIRTSGPAVLQPEGSRLPNPKCTVCSMGHALVTLDTDNFTLRGFFQIIRDEFSLEEASLDVENRE